MKLAMTVTVKTIDTQRWTCRIELFQFTGPPLVGRCTPNCFAVLGVQALPAAELHGVARDDAADRGAGSKWSSTSKQMCQPAAPIAM